ncbi:MAG: cytochrome P450 [Caldilineaceae bacterium]
MTTMSAGSSLNKSAQKTPPSMGSWPFGVLPEFRRDQLGLYSRAFRQYGDIVRMRFGPFWSYAIFHPDYLKHVFVDNNKNYKRNEAGNGLLKAMLGETLLTSDGDFWLRQRRLMQPAFHRQKIMGFGSIMTDNTQKMLTEWDKRAEGEMLDIDKEMMRLTLRIVGLSLFSIDLLTESAELGRSITASSEYFNYRLGRIFAWPLWVPTKLNRELRTSNHAVEHIVPEMIAARHKLIAEQGSAEQSGRQVDMLDLLMESRYEDTGAPMDDEQMTREIRVLIGAGHETTSNTLTWTLYLLSKNPEVEEKLHAEVDGVLNGRRPGMEDLPKLPYTKMVIEEAMRLYPAAHANARQAINEDQLGNYTVPAGAGVVIMNYVIHRHPQFWPDPEKFDPERFAPANAAKQHPYAYVPFGGGPHKCIGFQFALYEAQLLLSMIAQRYSLKLKPGYQPVMQPLITLRAKDGMPMTLHRR